MASQDLLNAVRGMAPTEQLAGTLINLIDGTTQTAQNVTALTATAFTATTLTATTGTFTTLNIGATSIVPTAASINKLVQHAATAGIKVNCGMVTCTHSTTNTVASGLAALSWVTVSLAAAPTAAMCWAQANTSSATQFNVVGYMPTSNTQPTPTASTQNWIPVYWVGVGV